MRTISVVNASGSVGKTTITLALATLAAAAGQRVLVIDLDPQGNATLGAGGDTLTPGVVPALAAVAATPPASTPNTVRTQLVKDAVQTTEYGFDLLGAGTYASLQHAQDRADEDSSIEDLRAILACLDHDLVLIDCHVGLGLFPRVAIAVSDKVLTVVEPAKKESSGIPQLLGTIEDIHPHGREALGGIIVNRYAARARVSKAWLPVLRDTWGDDISPPVRVAEAVRQAYESAMPVPAYTNDAVTEDLAAVHTWLIERGVL